MKMALLRGLGAISALALAVGASAGVAAQEVDESALDALDTISPAVSQPVKEAAGAAELRAAMRRISYSPSDADALADAGHASLTLGDANAALNFFTRANVLRPHSGRIIAGLATATVRTENPFEALRLFDDAVRLGVSEQAIAVDRALAFDLLGNFGRAQQDYKLARTASISDELIIRQAISLALAGQKAEADGMLVPLLHKDNATAWRARAFMLAARGEFRESTKVTQGFMDAVSAQRMERYLRLMPDLTAAQQAAAIHLGHFPASQYVGRDSEQVRSLASAIAPVAPGPGDSRLIPAGDPLGPKSVKPAPAKNGKKSDPKRDRKAQEQEEIRAAIAQIPDSIKLPKTDLSRLSTDVARAKLAEAQAARVVSANTNGLPPPETARPAVRVELPPALTSAPGGAPISAPMTIAAVQADPATAEAPGIAPGIAPAIAASRSVAPASAPAPAPARAFDLAAIVGAIEIPESEQQLSVVPVDLKKIKPVAAKSAAAEAAARAKAEPAHPARFWVQIATGDAAALGFDYRKWSKKSPDLFKGQNGWTSAWGKTSRLLAGPFGDMKTAKKWESDFKKAGGNGFMWKSENGVVVTALRSK